MQTATKLKAMKPAERQSLINWLAFYDQWLWQMRVSSREACRFAKEDGLAFVTPPRMSIYAKRPDACERWKVEEVSISRKVMLTAGWWHRVMQWVEENRPDIAKAGCVVAVNTMASRSGVRCSDAAMKEGLLARGIDLPYRSERPKYVPKGPAAKV